MDVRGVFNNAFMMFTDRNYNRHIFFNIFISFCSFFEYFIHFFPIIMKSCFLFSTSKFCEMSPFSMMVLR